MFLIFGLKSLLVSGCRYDSFDSQVLTQIANPVGQHNSGQKMYLLKSVNCAAVEDCKALGKVTPTVEFHNCIIK